MIQAIILEPENEAVLLEQVELLRKDSKSKPIKSKPITEENNNNLESRLANLEQVCQSQLEEFRKDNRKIKLALAQIEHKVENSALEEKLIDTIVEKAIEIVRKRVSRN